MKYKKHYHVKHLNNYQLIEFDKNDVELFDEGLTLIYDWADENRVWLGV